MGVSNTSGLAVRTPPPGCSERRPLTGCHSCGAKAFTICASASDPSLERLEALAERITLPAGAVLIREGDDASHVFNITSGSVRVYKLLPDGRRQIIGFLFTGDFLGLAPGDAYVFSAEAMEPASACRFRRSAFRGLIEDSPSLEHALLDRASHELTAAQNQILLLGRRTAMERLAWFLLDLPGHDPSRPTDANQVRLPMTRGEIADYLGLTIETVSRVLGRLKALGVIHLASRDEVRIDKPKALRALADGEGAQTRP